MPGKPKTVERDPASDPARTLYQELAGDQAAPVAIPSERAATPDERTGTMLTPRYEDLGLIGTGGVGEVRRVRDIELNRVLAMKIVLPKMLDRRAVLARFVEEAQATAQLEHPGMVPVHDLGRLADGRVFFTMKEVRGTTLGEAIRRFHEAGAPSADGAWTFGRLMDAYRRTCEAVAHAHARGVLHRDLKPENVMVGAFGEVLVLDWGLVKVRGRASESPREADAVRTDRSEDDSLRTMLGTIAGTPAYMAPEQARGETDRLSPATDVYALGAILYEVLSGRPPYKGRSSVAVLGAVLKGPPPPPRGAIPVPEELVELCTRAMARDPADRFADAGALATEVVQWLEGARKRERALALVAQAREALPAVDELRRSAVRARAEAAALQDDVRPWDAVDRKRAGWEREDEASRLELLAEARELEVVQVLQGALTHQPDLPEAHDLLADLYRARHAEAEAAGWRISTARFEALLRAHDRGTHARWLSGDGALSLVTDPPGAEVELLKTVVRDRRLVTEPVRDLGATPLPEVALPMGSYVLRIRAPGRPAVLYPVRIGRGEHWDGGRPGGTDPFPVALPSEGELDPDDIYVPAGWAWVGGDRATRLALPRRRLWVDAFVIRRYPVTNRAYLAFLDALASEGSDGEEAALRHAPRERSGTADRAGQMVYGRGAAGRFELRADSDGDVWDPEWPVFLVDWHSAAAFAAWEARRSGLPWRLPGELEWEKAARGTDGRAFPWGDHFDATWACVRESHRPSSRPSPARVDEFPGDESPYGVRGMAGNSVDWCADRLRAEGPPCDGDLVLPPSPEPPSPDALMVSRGTGWNGPAEMARVYNRSASGPDHRSVVKGFRLARPYAP